jgi:type IV secretory pathway VirB10-like protein
VAQLRRLAGIALAAAALTALPAGAASTAGAPSVSPEKSALEDHVQQVEAAGRAREAFAPKPVDPSLARPAPAAPGPPPTGVVELPSPFPTREYVLGATGWQQLASGRRLTVYAGASGTDHALGVVVVVTTEAATENRTVATYPASGSRGPLTLVGARGDVVLLRDADARPVAFDVSTRRYSGP